MWSKSVLPKQASAEQLDEGGEQALAVLWTQLLRLVGGYLIEPLSAGNLFNDDEEKGRMPQGRKI